MINRAREIAQMMGYDGTNEILEAIGKGELVLLKVPNERRLEIANWIRRQLSETEVQRDHLADALDDLADGLELAMELTRYPADTDVCEMDLPHGWPSYCDKTVIS